MAQDITPEEKFRFEVTRLRGSQLMSQAELAKLAGLTHQTVVAKIESGERAVKLNEAVAIAESLQADLAEMIGLTRALD